MSNRVFNEEVTSSSKSIDTVDKLFEFLFNCKWSSDLEVLTTYDEEAASEELQTGAAVLDVPIELGGELPADDEIT